MKEMLKSIDETQEITNRLVDDFVQLEAKGSYAIHQALKNRDISIDDLQHALLHLRGIAMSTEIIANILKAVILGANP
jgi:uncharacterized coiled-coil DUF342 family protein